MRWRGLAVAIACIWVGCVEPDTPADPGTSGTLSTSTGEPATTMQPVTTAAADDMPDDDATSGPMTSAEGPADESSSSSGGFPPGPTCSVQEVTEGELVDPVVKGDEAGLIPAIVGDTLEDYCGCHTLMNNNQNLKYMFLKAPGGTLLLEYDDLNSGFDGGTLGTAMGEQVIAGTMPPGSCFFPEEPEAILTKWFMDGMPDGATFEAP